MRVAVVGVGYVGLVTAACLADSGNDVICVDNDHQKIDDLSNGIIPVYEPGLVEIVNRSHATVRLRFTTSLQKAVESSVMLFIAVGTPSAVDGSADISAVLDAASEIADHMDGYRVMPMAQAAPQGDVFCTLSGDMHVIRPEHVREMKDGAIVCNSGHFDVEIDMDGIAEMSADIIKDVQPDVDQYVMESGKSIYVLAQGRLVNLACAEGHPSCVMDMSFATQALTSRWCAAQKGKLGAGVHQVPEEIVNRVARLKLESMGIRIDRLTPEQKAYLAGWETGT